MQFSARDVQAMRDLKAQGKERYDWPDELYHLSDLVNLDTDGGPSLDYYGHGGYPYLYYWGKEYDISDGPLCGTCATATLREELSPDHDAETWGYTMFDVEHAGNVETCQGEYCEGCNEWIVEPSADVTYGTDDEGNEYFVCIGDCKRGQDESSTWLDMSEIAERFGHDAANLILDYYAQYPHPTREEQQAKLRAIAAERDRTAQLEAGQQELTGITNRQFLGYENYFTGQKYR